MGDRDLVGVIAELERDRQVCQQRLAQIDAALAAVRALVAARTPRKHRISRSEEYRQAASERMRAQWAAARAAGVVLNQRKAAV